MHQRRMMPRMLLFKVDAGMAGRAQASQAGDGPCVSRALEVPREPGALLARCLLGLLGASHVRSVPLALGAPRKEHCDLRPLVKRRLR